MFRNVYSYLFTNFYQNFRSQYIGDQKFIKSYLLFTQHNTIYSMYSCRHLYSDCCHRVLYILCQSFFRISRPFLLL